MDIRTADGEKDSERGIEVPVPRRRGVPVLLREGADSLSSEKWEKRDEEEEDSRSRDWGISLGKNQLLLGLCKEKTYNLPRPLEPSAMERFRPSFLICIATCCDSRQLIDPHSRCGV